MANRFNPPFNVEDYIEKISFLTLGGQTAFDPAPLVSAFEEQISTLYELNAQVAHDIAQLEKEVTSKEQNVADNMDTLGDETKLALEAFDQLSSGTKVVSQKIVHVGDSLEVKHLQRNRAVDTRTVMEHFAAFQVPNGALLAPFTGNPPDLHQCAEIIQKLDFIASQLPKAAQTTAKRIAEELKKTEQRLLFEFIRASDDTTKMKAYARTLFPFKSYDKCVKGFIDNFIKERSDKFQVATEISSVLEAIESTCVEAKDRIELIFKYTHPVTISFIQTIIKNVLGKFISKYIVFTGKQADTYLDRLHVAYQKTQKMLERLSLKINVSDPGGMLKGNLLRNVFEDYLQNYIPMEEGSLKSLYEADIHHALAPTMKGMHRDASPNRRGRSRKGKLNTAAVVTQNSDRSPRVGDILSNGVLINLDTVLSMVHENKQALKRCETLMTPSALPDFANRIFQQLLEALGLIYLKPALELAIETISAKGVSVESNNQFLNVVEDVNNAIYFLMKHFEDTVLPLVRPSINVYQTCVHQKDTVLAQLESLLSQGLNYSMRAIVAHCGSLLHKRQKRSDFSPDDNDMSAFNSTCTEACASCCDVIASHTAAVKKCLNGKNEDIVFHEFGKRIYSMLLDHFKLQLPNASGAMLLVRDLAKYADCVHEFNNKPSDQMFSDLKFAGHVLCCPKDQIMNLANENNISYELAHVFAKLRSDYSVKDGVHELFAQHGHH